ncbi:MAG: DUF2508 family protein [Tissierellia bacterium]|nr:DUF2508 family protein [Tissierellia bacterium]
MTRIKNYYRDKAYNIIKLINIISDKYKGREISEKEEIIENLNKAHEEWKSKEKYFQTVTDPDLVDHAIYELEASKIKYAYLLKKAKELNIE